MDNYAFMFPLALVVMGTVYLIVEYRKYQMDRHRAGRDRYRKPDELPDELVLKRSAHDVDSKNMRPFIFAMVAIVLLILFAPILDAVKDVNEFAAEELLLKYVEHLREHPSQLFNLLAMILISIVVPVIGRAAIKNERLILSRNGIRYCSPFSVLKIPGVNTGWYIQWPDIESLILGSGIGGGQLKILTLDGKSRTLMAFAWHESGNYKGSDNQSLFSDISHQRKLQTDQEYAMRSSPVLKFISEVAGLEIQSRENTGLSFDLMKNQYKKIAVIIVFAILAYVFIDLILNSETYAEDSPIILFIATGVVAAIAFAFWFIKNAVPKDNALLLAILLGGMVGLALYPGLLRINQLTDNIGIRPYTYIHLQGPYFESTDAGMPDIVMFEDSYWYSLPDGVEMTFMLRKGGLNFYQIDMAPVYQKTRMWYCIRGQEGNEAKVKQCEKDFL